MKWRFAAPLLLPVTAFGAAIAATPQLPPTIVQDRSALERLLGNSGISLQWISWASSERGKLKPSWQNKTLFVSGRQSSRDGAGRMSVEGRIVRIAKTEFLLDGTIIVENTPDPGRQCSKTGEWRFAITQNRKYWRLRDFEWCDGLTDYIDIYF